MENSNVWAGEHTLAYRGGTIIVTVFWRNGWRYMTHPTDVSGPYGTSEAAMRAVLERF